jgi:hypothetical protein
MLEVAVQVQFRTVAGSGTGSWLFGVEVVVRVQVGFVFDEVTIHV